MTPVLAAEPASHLGGMTWFPYTLIRQGTQVPKILYKTRLSPKLLSAHPALRKHVLHECDIKLSRGSRLAMRLIVTKKGQRNFRNITKAIGCTGYTKDTEGVVRYFTQYWTETDDDTGEIKDTWYVTDRRYFCAMVLQQGKCDFNTIAHECAHAGIIYALRNPRHNWGGNARGKLIDLGKPFGFNPPHVGYDEGCEKIAYPTGAIMQKVMEALHDWKVWG